MLEGVGVAPGVLDAAGVGVDVGASEAGVAEGEGVGVTLTAHSCEAVGAENTGVGAGQQARSQHRVRSHDRLDDDAVLRGGRLLEGVNDPPPHAAATRTKEISVKSRAANGPARLPCNDIT